MEALSWRTKMFIVIKPDQNPIEISTVSDEAFDDCCGDCIWNGAPHELLNIQSIPQLKEILFKYIEGDDEKFREEWDVFSDEIDENCEDIDEIEKIIILQEFYGCGSLADDSAHEFCDALGSEEEARKLIGDLFEDITSAVSSKHIFQGSIAYVVDLECRTLEKMADPYGSLEYDLFPDRFDV